MDFYTRYAAYQAAIEQYLEGLFSTDKPYGRLQEAMRYSLLGGGKRIRPVLTLEMARLGGIDWHLALPYACALELVHTYSLIHDDLPCMDDDDLRRGKPTCHKAYGETLAVLAGDALQPEAFRLIAEAPCMSAESRVEAIRVLSHAAGADGMVAGQVIDTLCGVSTQQELTGMYRLKTGVMISAAAELGCVASGMPATMRQQAIAFADKLGLAFQIRDDMLDVVGDEAVFGKPIGSDREEGKVTFVDVLGLEVSGDAYMWSVSSAHTKRRHLCTHYEIWFFGPAFGSGQRIATGSPTKAKIRCGLRKIYDYYYGGNSNENDPAHFSV